MNAKPFLTAILITLVGAATAASAAPDRDTRFTPFEPAAPIASTSPFEGPSLHVPRTGDDACSRMFCHEGTRCEVGPAGATCVPELRRCVCSSIYRPVCGHDGRTYSNECEARCRDIPIAFPGACSCGTTCLDRNATFSPDF